MRLREAVTHWHIIAVEPSHLTEWPSNLA